MTEALIYVRVSTDEQAKSGLGLEDQEERCRAYCAMRGLEVAEVLKDPGVSGGKSLETRPGGSRLLQETSGPRPRVRHAEHRCGSAIIRPRSHPPPDPSSASAPRTA